MARVFVTGSADGLGLLAARKLADSGHEVWLHARSDTRVRDASQALPGARGVLLGELASMGETRRLAEEANRVGPFDAVIHNAGIGLDEKHTETPDGLEHVFVINVLAPYLLTALIEPPQRLIYLSSGLHQGGKPDLDDLQWRKRRWNGSQAYSDSKLMDAALAFAVARRWPKVRSNAVEPGWVPTKMGGPGAPDDLELGAATQAWLAVSDETAAKVSGRYFFHQKERQPHPLVADVEFQDRFLRECERLTGVAISPTK